MLRRVLTKDGRSRAFINDQPVGVALLRRAARAAGRGAGPARADRPRRSGEPRRPARRVRRAAGRCARPWPRHGAAGARRLRRWQAARDGDRRGGARRGVAAPRGRRAGRSGAAARTRRSGSRRSASVCSRASGAPRRSPRRSPNWRRATGAARRPRRRCAPRAARCSGWSRRRSRMRPIRRARRSPRWSARRRRWPRRRRFLTRLAHEADADPRLLEQAEERLFALRAAARKHAVAVAELPALLDTLCARLAALETGHRRGGRAGAGGAAGARGLCAVGHGAGGRRGGRRRRRLDRAVAKELPPLRLDKARFHAEVAALAEADWGPAGLDAVQLPDRDQSGPGIWAARADRLGRRAVAADAGAEGGAVIRLARADAWCSTRWMPISAAPPRRRSVSGWRAWRSGCRCWW